jgi:hypothetical protein
MGYTLRQVEAESKFCQSLTVEAWERAVPLQAIKAVLPPQGIQAQRERKLKMIVTVWVVIAPHLYAHLSIPHVMRQLARGLRFIWPDPSYRLPKASALTDPALPGYGEVHRLVTTLLDPAVAPAFELVCAYHERWEIEILIDETDTHQRLSDRPVRSRKPLGVLQELYGLLIAHDAIRFLMHEAAVQHGLDPDRLSFVHALQVIRDAIAEFQMVTPAQWPMLYQR